MIRNLKALGLLFVAALAMSAVAASGAQAEEGDPGTFTAGKTGGEPEHTHSEIVGTQVGTAHDNHFITEEGSVNCTNSGVSYTGTTETGTETELTITPNYEECWTYTTVDPETIETGLPVTVKTTGCDYNFNQPEAKANKTTQVPRT